MMQLNLVVELFIIGTLAHVPFLLLVLALRPGWIEKLQGALGDSSGILVLFVAAWTYLLGILVNAGVFKLLSWSRWPIRAWYPRFRQSHFNDLYFDAVQVPRKLISNDELVERTLLYVDTKNQAFAPKQEFFTSMMRLLRASALIACISAPLLPLFLVDYPYLWKRILVGFLVSCAICFFLGKASKELSGINTGDY